MSRTASNPQPADQIVHGWGAVAEQGRAILESSFHTCAAEVGAFFEELARDNAEAAEAIGRCRTPLDLLAVQQRWLLERTEACMTAGMRMVLGGLHEPEAAAAEEAAFRLPE